MVTIYIVLGILYESYIHPFTILTGLPSAVVGALLALRLFGMDLSLIAVIGLLMLIGIVKKNAIMMIDVALTTQREGKDPADCDLRGGAAALPADHDDDAGRAVRRAADRARHRRRRGAAPAAGRGRGRRPAGVAGADALHDAGALHLHGAGGAGRTRSAGADRPHAGIAPTQRTQLNIGCWQTADGHHRGPRDQLFQWQRHPVSKNCCMRNVNIRNFRIWHFSDLANESSVGLLCGVERTFLQSLILAV